MSTPKTEEPLELVTGFLENNETNQLEQYLDSLSDADQAWLISRLGEDEKTALFNAISTELAAELMEGMFDDQAADIIEELPVDQAAAIVDEMASDEQADLLSHLGEDRAEAILSSMDPEEAEDARLLLQSAKDVAGGVMITEYLAYTEEMRTKKVIADLRNQGEKYEDYEIQYLYITSNTGKLTGILPLRKLLLAPKDTPLSSIAIKDPIHVNVDATLDELSNLFGQYEFMGIPVTNDEGILIGVVMRRDVLEAVDERLNRTFLNFSGIVGGEELRSMPLLTRSFHRLSWLSINIVLNVIAASVIAMYQETLAAAIALAVFLPIISDMSGCSGNQAVAVSIRELSVGQVKPHELLRVLSKEAGIGVINGLVLGLLIAAVAVMWQGNFYLGLVVGSALALNSIFAVCLGGVIPLVLRGFKMDPALASSPILTTVTDMCGFFLVLSFATAILPKLAS